MFPIRMKTTAKLEKILKSGICEKCKKTGIDVGKFSNKDLDIHFYICGNCVQKYYKSNNVKKPKKKEK